MNTAQGIPKSILNQGDFVFLFQVCHKDNYSSPQRKSFFDKSFNKILAKNIESDIMVRVAPHLHEPFTIKIHKSVCEFRHQYGFDRTDSS